MSPRTIKGIEGLRAAVGEHLGSSSWLTLTPERVELFARVTDDPDPKSGIASGFMMPSLLGALLPDIVLTSGFSLVVNYGLERMRFGPPVPANGRIRLGIRLLSADDIAGGVQAVFEATFELDGADEPACVAAVILRYYE